MVRVSQYYRTVVDLNTGTCVEEPDFTYTDIDLFNLESKLYPFIRDNYPIGTYMIYGGDEDGDRSYLTVELKFDGDVIELTTGQEEELEQAIKDAITLYPDYCLVYPFVTKSVIYTGNELIPAWYINSVLPIIDIEQLVHYKRDGKVLPDDEQYFVPLYPFMHKNGIYIRSADLKSVDSISNQIVIGIKNKVIELFNECYLVNLPQEVVNSWQFELVMETDDFSVHRLPWSSSKIKKTYGSMVNYINSIVLSDNNTRLMVTENKVVIHWLTYYLQTQYDPNLIPIFDGPHLHIKINNYNDLQLIATLITMAEAESSGKVMIIKTNRLAWCIIYEQLSIKSGNDDCVYYFTEDHMRPCEFSCLMKLNDNIDFYRNKFINAAKSLFDTLENDLPNLHERLIANGHNADIIKSLGVPELIERGMIDLSV